MSRSQLARNGRANSNEHSRQCRQTQETKRVQESVGRIGVPRQQKCDNYSPARAQHRAIKDVEILPLLFPLPLFQQVLPCLAMGRNKPSFRWLCCYEFGTRGRFHSIALLRQGGRRRCPRRKQRSFLLRDRRNLLFGLRLELMGHSEGGCSGIQVFRYSVFRYSVFGKTLFSQALSEYLNTKHLNT